MDAGKGYNISMNQDKRHKISTREVRFALDEITDIRKKLSEAMEYLLTDKKGVEDIDAIIHELKQIRRKLTGKRQSLPYYGRVDTLLEQMHDTLRDFNQTH